jgi:hypothetical protein
VVQGGCFGDVGQDVAFEGYFVFDALADEPGEIDGGVDADRGEGCAGVAVWGEL